MSFWTTLFGGIAEPIAKVATSAIDASATKDTNATDEVDSARSFAAPTEQPGVINQLVDAANRFVRPGTTTYVLGGLAGWWRLPDLDQYDPRWIAAGGIILTFWFGGRALLKDLPMGIVAALAAWSKFRGK